MRALFVVLAALALPAGCASLQMPALPAAVQPAASLVPEHNQKLVEAKLCCASFRDIRYVALGGGKEISANVGTDAPVFDFRAGRSYFAAFELPAGGAARKLMLKTYAVNANVIRVAHVFIPAVQFLDAEHRSLDIFLPAYETHIPRYTGKWWAEAELAVPAAARYAIVLDAKSVSGLTWRAYGGDPVFVRGGPTGEISVLPRGG
jgi:hypothetical protein